MKLYLKNLLTQIGTIPTTLITGLQKITGNAYTLITFVFSLVVVYDFIKLGQNGIIKYVLSVFQETIKIAKDGGWIVVVIMLLFLMIDKRIK
jgi:diacylglycerol kinase